MTYRTSYRLTTSASVGVGAIVARFLPYPEESTLMTWPQFAVMAVLISIVTFVFLVAAGYPRKGA